MLFAALNDPYENSASRGGIVNRTLGGRYEILESLGEGPLLAAYRARDRQANRIVTVKTLTPAFARRDEVVAALRDGVGQSLALNHHAIARVLDIGEDDATGVTYLAEEYIRGVDLKERIRRTAPLQVAAAIDTALSLAEALEAAHARNLAHSDVRPQNILVGPDGQTKLTNFGLALALHRAGDDPSVLQRVAAYTAPDAARSSAPTPSADLYSLGIVLYEMLTGQVPFAGSNALQVASRHAQEPVPSPRAINSGIPVAVDGIVQKLLAKTPQARYPNATELLRDLRQVRDALRYGKSLSWSPLDKPTLPLPTPVPAAAETGTVAPRRPPVAPAANTAASAAATSAAGQRASLTVREPETGRTLAYSDPEEEPIVPQRSSGLRWLTALNILGLVGLALALSFLAVSVRAILRPTSEIVLPNLVGKPIAEAKSLAESKNFSVSVVDEEYRDDTPKGVVFKMGETAGRTIKEGRQVPVWISRGPRIAVVPDVSGKTFERARKDLEAAGLRLGDVTRQFDPLAAEGTVTGQNPGVGEDQPRGTPVDLTLSKGEEPTPTPEPIPTPEPYVPGTYGEGSSGSTDPGPSTPRYFKVKYQVPADDAAHRIRVDISDDNGQRTEYDQSHNSGELVFLKQVQAYGRKIVVKVYDNDELKKEGTIN